MLVAFGVVVMFDVGVSGQPFRPTFGLLLAKPPVSVMMTNHRIKSIPRIVFRIIPHATIPPGIARKHCIEVMHTSPYLSFAFFF